MRLSVESVEVTWLDLDVDDAELAVLARSLSPDERTRVARLASPLLQRRATARLGLRRRVLAGSLDVEPRDVEFDVTPAGKPEVSAPRGAAVAFSASHCDAVGVVAVGVGRQVGVDVESLPELDEARRLVRRITTPEEAIAIEGLDGRPLREALLRLWTRKEAWAKATGDGLGVGLDRLCVPLSDEPWGERLGAEVPAWWLFALPCAGSGDLAAALVVSGSGVGGAPSVSVALARESPSS